MLFLNNITTSIDCETDLKLYHIDKALSNELMGVVGVEIIGPSLRAAYKDKQYLIRCYNDGDKFFEIPLGNFLFIFLLYRCNSHLH
jgi:hypothetical protein